MNRSPRLSNQGKYSVGYCCLVGALLAGFFMLAPVSAFAETLDRYRADVKESNALVSNLLYPDEEDESVADYGKLETESLKKIRARLPASEKVEWQGATIETDNRWLAEKLDKFEQTADDARRQDVLTEISERLEAIELKLDELEKPSAVNRSKDEDKQKLAEILRREEYQKPAEQPPSLAEKIQKQIAEWLAKIFPRPQITPAAGEGFQSFSLVLQILLYVAILAAVAFVIYRFAPFLLKRFQNRDKSGTKERVILGERLAANETAVNLFAEAENLARQGDLRGAIRKGYIALLCDLSDRRIIRLAEHKTNRDYLRDVRRLDELHRAMNGLTLNYERHWYGFDEAGKTDWESFRDGYQRAVSAEH